MSTVTPPPARSVAVALVGWVTLVLGTVQVGFGAYFLVTLEQERARLQAEMDEEKAQREQALKEGKQPPPAKHGGWGFLGACCISGLMAVAAFVLIHGLLWVLAG